MVATRLAFYQALLDDPYLEDIDEWPDNHVRWLLEAFYSLSMGRIKLTKTTHKRLLEHKNVLLKITEQRNYDKARRVLKQYAQPLLSAILPQVIIHIRAKKCKNDREYNNLLKEYDQSDAESDDQDEEDEEGEEDEEDEEDEDEEEEQESGEEVQEEAEEDDDEQE